MNVIFDTSVWIRHFRKSEYELVEALEDGNILIHEVVVGELAVGRVPSPKQTISDLLKLPFAPVIPFKDLLEFIHNRKLISKGLSWADIHLLASALNANASLVTYDLPLARAWQKIAR